MKNILTISILLSITACGETTSNKSENKQIELIKDWKMLDNPDYSVQYPSEWELSQSGQMGTSFVLFAPLDSESDDFKENVNMIVQDLSGRNLDLNSYTELSERQIKTMVVNSNLLESKRMKDERGEYQKVSYTGDQGIYKLLFIQYYWVIDSKAFLLTFTCEQDEREKYQEIGQKIMNSFRLKQ